MPRLIRLYILQVLAGFGLSTVFVGILLWQNVANLYHLVTHTEAGLLAVFLLWLFNGLVFASVQFALAAMLMQDNGTPPSGGKRDMVLAYQPVRVPVDQAPSNQLTRRRH